MKDMIRINLSKRKIWQKIHPPPNNSVNWNCSIVACLSPDVHAALLLQTTSLFEDGEEAPSSSPPQGISWWKGRDDVVGEGGREGARGDTALREISFPALYGENGISWENLARRWEMYPPNIDNHLFISWQQHGENAQTSSEMKEFFTLLLVFVWCGTTGPCFIFDTWRRS